MSGDSEETKIGPLGHLRVLDLASSSTGYCGKLFADLGAEVLRIVSPGVDSQLEGAGLSPLYDLYALYTNANKRSLEFDLEKDEERARFRVLAADSDLILDGLPAGRLAERGLGYADLSADHPELVMTSITGFGQTGPHRDNRSNDLVASALGAAMVSIGDPADPPVRLAGHQADVTTATLAAASSLIALHHRDRTGRGQHVDVSSLEVMASTTHITGVGKWLEDGIIPKRVGHGARRSRCHRAPIRCQGRSRLSHGESAGALGGARAQWINELTGNEEVLLRRISRSPHRVGFPIASCSTCLHWRSHQPVLTVDEVIPRGAASTHSGHARSVRQRTLQQIRICSGAKISSSTSKSKQDGEVPTPGAPYRLESDAVEVESFGACGQGNSLRSSRVKRNTAKRSDVATPVCDAPKRQPKHRATVHLQDYASSSSAAGSRGAMDRPDTRVGRCRSHQGRIPRPVPGRAATLRSTTRAGARHAATNARLGLQIGVRGNDS